MEAAKSEAAMILAEVGFQVDEIPVADGQRADLRVADDASTYHVEVKERFDAAELVDRRIDCLNRGQVYEQADLLAQNDRISGILRSARKQLDATPKEPSTFQLIWFHADGIDADIRRQQAFSTFYGNVGLIALDPPGSKIPTCFYFDYSAAFSMPSVEALILTDHTHLQFCVNEFSERVDDFRASRLYRTFDELGGVIDPVALASEGKIISCRANVPRKNDDVVARALQAQTGILYSPIRLTSHACSARVQRSKLPVSEIPGEWE